MPLRRPCPLPCSSGFPWHDRGEVVGVRSGDGGSRCAMTVVVGRGATGASAGRSTCGWSSSSDPRRPWARPWSWRPRRRWPPPRSRYPDFAEAVRSTRRGSPEPDPVTASRCLRNGAPVPNTANPGTADALGSLIIRNLTPGPGTPGTTRRPGSQRRRSPSWRPAPTRRMTRPSTPTRLFTRVSTTSPCETGSSWRRRSATPTAGPAARPHPVPTVIEYSGYTVAAPTDPIPSLLAKALGTTCHGCGDPNLLPDSATDVGAVVARVSGFATVSLQMRGTGCSGGAFRSLRLPVRLRRLRRRSRSWPTRTGWPITRSAWWASATRDCPSSLRPGPTHPGSPPSPHEPDRRPVLNGVPRRHLQRRLRGRVDRAADRRRQARGHLARRAPRATVDHTAVRRRAAVDLLRDRRRAGRQPRHLVDLPGQPGTPRAVREPVELAGPKLVAPHGGAGRDPSLFDRRSMRQWATRITVPVFISGAMEDEQTGPQWPVLLSAFPATTPVYANLVNGDHIDSTDPQIISRWLEFLDIYVADRVPTAAQCAHPHGSRRFHQLRLRHVGAGSAAGHAFHDGDDGDPGTSRVRGSIHGSKSSSTTGPARSAPVTRSRRTQPALRSGHRRAPSRRTTFGTGRRPRARRLRSVRAPRR